MCSCRWQRDRRDALTWQGTERSPCRQGATRAAPGPDPGLCLPSPQVRPHVTDFADPLGGLLVGATPRVHPSEMPAERGRTMRVQRVLRDAVLTAAVTCSALAVLTGCRGESARSATPVPASASDTAFGPSQGLGNGSGKTYITLDGDGRPTEVGVRLSRTALEGLPQSGIMLMLDFPDQAGTTAFDHVMLNWNPQGHEPIGLFGK